GWIRESAAYSGPSGESSAGRSLMRRSLGEALGLSGEPDRWAIFRDWRSGLEFLRSAGDLRERGLFVELNAYQCQVFLDWREVADGPSRQYARLAERLGGRGVPSVEAAMRELQLAPIRDAARELARSGVLGRIVDVGLAQTRAVAVSAGRAVEPPAAALEPPTGSAAEPPARPAAESPADIDGLLATAERGIAGLLGALEEATGLSGDAGGAAREARQRLAAILRLPHLEADLGSGGAEAGSTAGVALAAARSLGDGLAARWTWSTLVVWPVAAAVSRYATAADGTSRPVVALDELQLGAVLAETLRELGEDEAAAWRSVELIRILVGLPRLARAAGPAAGAPLGAATDDALSPGRPTTPAAEATTTPAAGAAPAATPGASPHSVSPTPAARRAMVAALLTDPDVRPFIRVNRWEGVSWFQQEAFEQLLWWMLVLDAVDALASDPSPAAVGPILARAMGLAEALRDAGQTAGYRVDRLAEGLPETEA
ncbi:MAG: hypothetical protein ACXWNG_05640, partial [Candidatus Limnocylindrales bacterium]